MEDFIPSDFEKKADEKHGFILGFRTGKTWKMILAAIYYAVTVLSMVLCVLNDMLSVPLKISGVLNNLFMIMLPYFVDGIVTVCKTKKKKPLIIAAIACVVCFSTAYGLNRAYGMKSGNYIYNTGKEHMSEAMNHIGGGSSRRSSSAGKAMQNMGSGGFISPRGEMNSGPMGADSPEIAPKGGASGGEMGASGEMAGGMDRSGSQGVTASVPQPNWENIIKDFNHSYNLGVKRHLGQRYLLRDTVYEAGGGPSPYIVFKRDNMTAYMYFSEDYSDAVGRIKKGQPCAVTVTCTSAPSGNVISFVGCSIGG